MELMIDGKNVLKPVDLKKNKEEILQQRASIMSEVDLTHFKESIGPFNANVKGGDLNGLVEQLQDYFVDINQRNAMIYDELDTIFNTVESIHDGSIKGMIVGIQSAQTAIKQSDDAMERIRETLLELNQFKKNLEENTIHLQDIDLIWEATQRLEEECSRLEQVFSTEKDKLVQKFNALVERMDQMEQRMADKTEVEKKVIEIQSKVKMLYYMFGGMGAVVILHILLNVMRIF